MDQTERPVSRSAIRFSASGDAHIDALMHGHGYRWGHGAGTTASLTYSMAAPSGASPFTPWMADATRRALAAWADVADLTFVESGDRASATLRFALTDQTLESQPRAAAWASVPGMHADAGEIWASTTASRLEAYGHSGFQFLMLHEIGHALGLDHPHGADSHAAESIQSIMADGQPRSLWSQVRPDGTMDQRMVFRDTPLRDDIAAIQHLYGANMRTRTGNDSYTVSPDIPLYQCIWDAGGTDTLNAAAFDGPCTIDLREGAFSSFSFTSADRRPGVSYDGSNVVSIARGVTIENAVGGRGSDTLVGNAAANTLNAGSGNDRLIASGGNDLLIGGEGIDVAVYAGPRASYVLSAGQVHKPGGERDLLVEVERISFDDGAIAFDFAGHAGTVSKLLGVLFGPPVAHPVYAGIGLRLLDGGLSAEALAELAVATAEFTRHGAIGSDEQVVEKLFFNATGVSPTVLQRDALVEQIASGQRTRGQLALQLAEHEANLARIDYVELARAGLAFI